MNLFNTLQRFITGSNTDTEPSTDTTQTPNQSEHSSENSTDHTTEIGITLNTCQGCGKNILEHEESTEIPPYGEFHADSDCTPSLEV
jgi:hypothetical protein